MIMGADWRSLTWQEYLIRLAGWNAAHDPDAPRGDQDFSRLKRAMDAHTVH